MKEHAQEQLNKESLPMQEIEETFTLEQIMEEFGSGASAEDVIASGEEIAQFEQWNPEEEIPQTPVEEPAELPEVPEEPAERMPQEAPAEEMAESAEDTEAQEFAPETKNEEERPPKQKREKQPKKPKKQKKAKLPQQPIQVKKPPEEEHILSPEELIYDNRQKLGKSRLRLGLATAVCVLSLFLTVYRDKAMQFIPQLNDARLQGWASVGLLMLCMALCFDVIGEGIRQIISVHLRAEALSLVTTLFILIDSFPAIHAGRFPFAAIGTLLLCFNLLGLSDGWQANIRTLKSVQTADPPFAVRESKQIRGSESGLYAGSGDASQFMHDFGKRDLTDRVMEIYVPVMLLLSIAAAGVIAAMYHRDFLWCLTLILMGVSPLCAGLCYKRPFALLATRLSKLGAALCGWEGAKIFSGRHTILISDTDVFPKENISLNGMKLYGEHDMSRMISYASTVTFCCDSPLAYLFDQLRETENCRRYEVRAIRSYEGGGVGADIMGDIVLMGSLKFMNSMGVHMDAGMKVKQAVYLSVNGELACVFAMKYKPAHSVANGLDAIVSDSHFDAVLATRDFLVNPAFLQSKYGVDADLLDYPLVKEREALSEKKLSEEGRQGAILGKNSFAEFAAVVAGGRDLRTCVQFGTVLCVFAGLFCGMILGLMALFGAVKTASCMNVAILLLVWALPGLLLSRWTKKK